MEKNLNRKFKASKFQATGNDFVLINNITEKLDKSIFNELAKKITDRNYSIGADGLILIDRSTDSEFKMVFLNSDGNYGEMCGNGARAIARFAHEEGLAGVNMEFETLAGKVKAIRLDENTYKIALNEVTTLKKGISVKINGQEYTGDYIELGNPGLPHFVLELKDMEPVASDELLKLGKALRYSDAFPKGANINFYKTHDGNIKAITYERGVEDFTKACGTGAASIAYSIQKNNSNNNEVIQINMPGGKLQIEVNDNILYLTGDVRRVFDTTLNLLDVVDS